MIRKATIKSFILLSISSVPSFLPFFSSSLFSLSLYFLFESYQSPMLFFYLPFLPFLSSSLISLSPSSLCCFHPLLLSWSLGHLLHVLVQDINGSFETLWMLNGEDQEGKCKSSLCSSLHQLALNLFRDIWVPCYMLLVLLQDTNGRVSKILWMFNWDKEKGKYTSFLCPSLRQRDLHSLRDIWASYYLLLVLFQDINGRL